MGLFIIGMIISSIGSLAALVCGILVGVKILNKYGTGQGVAAILLAIFCGIVTFIWGWVKVGELGIQQLMKWYTVAVVVAIVGSVLYFIGAASAGAEGFGEMQNQMENFDQEAFQEQMQRAIEEAQEQAQPGQ